MLTDERFHSERGKVDKYNRKIKKKGKKATLQELEKLYTIEHNEDDDKDREERLSESDQDKGGDQLDYLTKLSRGEIEVSSSSSEEESEESGDEDEGQDGEDISSDEGEENEMEEEEGGVSLISQFADQSSIPTCEEMLTRRVAIQHLWWEMTRLNMKCV